MKKKGFTLVELLVVIAIIALLMGILMPALARVRQIAYRLYCGTNLSGIGKAMLIYSNDYDDELPRAGNSNGGWVRQLPNFAAPTAALAYGPTGASSITSQFYLLIKYAEVTPKSFLCKGDSGVSEFSPSNPLYGIGDRDLTDLFDFGTTGQLHCSYSYHSVYSNYGMTSSSDPGMAMAADPNPWLNGFELPARTDADWNRFSPSSGDRESMKAGNAQTHQDDGQNVLFVDGHTTFEKESFCGVDNDNIYTSWSSLSPTNPDDKRKGMRPTQANPSLPGARARNDSVLITDHYLAGRQ